MAFIDYYKILGIDKNTQQDEIRSAYKKRAKQFHPDLHPNDPKAKAKFQALNEAYDVLSDPAKRKKYDQYGEHWKETQGFGNGGFGGFGGGQAQDFDFSAFEGMGGGFSSFFEQIFGGMGARGPQHSHQAGGCHGGCHNSNSTEAQATVDLDIYTALLGGEVIIQAGQSKLKMKIKPCTQQGSKVRLKGKGRTLPNGTKGDLIITYNIKMPTSLTPHQMELLKEMRQG